MADDFLQRGAGTGSGECPPGSTPDTPWVDPPLRPEPPCGPELPAPTPETFIYPVPAPVPLPSVPTDVPPLPVPSDPLTLTCADIPAGPPIGTNVTLPEGYTALEFLFQDIPYIRDDQLAYIGSLEPVQRAAALNASQEQLAALLRLTSSQAQAVREALDDLQEQANAAALEAAQSLLACVWESAEQTAQCGDGALTSPFGPPPAGVNNPVTVPAGTATSTTSQANADEQALLSAQAALGCWWGNAEITVSCQDLGFSEQVPNDEEPVYPGQPLRIGTVVLAKNLVFSSSSQTEANETARALALAQLSCFYINAPVSLNCPDGVADLGPADIINGTPGSSVSIPEGFIASVVSVADANDQATTLAQTLLSCYWLNGPQTATCQPQVADVRGESVSVPPSQTQGQWQVTVAGATVQSEISQEDADAQAAALAAGQLVCVYCNVEVPPLCAQQDSPIPLPPGVIDSSWSLDATLGLAANVFCADNAQAAQDLSQSVADIPAQTFASGENCTFGNDEVRGSCTPAPGVVSPEYPPPPYTGYSVIDPITGILSPNSRPAPGSEIVLAANTIIVGTVEAAAAGMGGKAYANYLATELIRSMLNCFFDNDPQGGACGEYRGDWPKPKERANRGKFKGHVADVAAATVQSYNGKFEANQQAEAMAQAMSLCLWGNDLITVTCPPSNNIAGKEQASLAANAVTASSIKEANNIAREIARGFCDLIGEAEAGAPGNDGAQTDCEGPCYGYYS